MELFLHNKISEEQTLWWNLYSVHKESSMELDKILYKESSLRNLYNYTIKFPTEEKYIQRDFFKNYYVVKIIISHVNFIIIIIIQTTCKYHYMIIIHYIRIVLPGNYTT
jgi:hypothetical protein